MIVDRPPPLGTRQPGPGRAEPGPAPVSRAGGWGQPTVLPMSALMCCRRGITCRSATGKTGIDRGRATRTPSSGAPIHAARRAFQCLATTGSARASTATAPAANTQEQQAIRVVGPARDVGQHVGEEQQGGQSEEPGGRLAHQAHQSDASEGHREHTEIEQLEGEPEGVVAEPGVGGLECMGHRHLWEAMGRAPVKVMGCLPVQVRRPQSHGHQEPQPGPPGRQRPAPGREQHAHEQGQHPQCQQVLVLQADAGHQPGGQPQPGACTGDGRQDQASIGARGPWST